MRVESSVTSISWIPSEAVDPIPFPDLRPEPEVHILGVEVDGDAIAEVGPGAILGEHAALGVVRRTATLRAVTRCRVAVASAEDLDHGALTEVARDHRREVSSPGVHGEEPGRPVAAVTD